MRLRSWQIALATAALVLLSIVFAWPFIWMISTSLKAQEKVQSAPTEVIPRASFAKVDGIWTHAKPLGRVDGLLQVQLAGGPREGEIIELPPGEIRIRPHLHIENYAQGLSGFPFGRYLLNTLFVSAITVFGTVLSCSLVAYGLACVNWRGRELLFWIMLSTMMLPGQVTMIPLFLTFKQLGWIDTYLPLLVPAFLGNAFFIFLLRQFYRSVPVELFEAARIDGCSDLRIWGQIILPLSRPALLVVALFSFMATWNDFLGPLIYLMDENKYTLSIGLTMFQGQYSRDWGPMMAMSVLMTLPVVVLFFFTQRTFIQGVKLAGIKG